ncbi:MAG: hypothetical protein HQL24_06820 [Candidatus Omnitrophica bacterium]|nr:hypothetical protein [Candidatus Omnitrophota bacterium]
MKRLVDVHTDEIMAGSAETILHSDAKRACMVLCAYDSMKKIGGLAHAMFLSGPAAEKKHSSAAIREADRAIDEMLSDMMMMGARKENIEVCFIAGENVPHKQNDPEYNKTLTSALEVLKQKQIKLREGSLNDVGNRHICFDVETGSVSTTEK